MRPPSPRLAEGIVTHVPRNPVDVALARRQWEAYVEALDRSGWDLVEVPVAEDCPDSAFIEDALVMFGELAVVTRPGREERRPETAAVDELVRGLGHPVHHLEVPATLDGGDVLKVGSTVYVGLGGRTNQAGVDQLAGIIEPAGYQVVPVPVDRVLHLKSGVTALPDGSIIGYPPMVDAPERFDEFRPVAEEAGAYVVLLGGDRLLMAADAPNTEEQFRGLGYEPITVDISEFQKLEGCVTCLSVRIRRPRS